MKPSSQPPRTPSRLSDSLHHQLNMYALAASAAGVGMIALASPAEAKIVYTPTQIVIGDNSRYNLDLNHDKIADFTLLNSSSCSDVCGEKFWLTAPVGNGAVGYRTDSGYGPPLADALKMGSRIGPGDQFESRTATMCWGPRGSCWGAWCNVRNRYLGLRFKIKGKTHYGWARLTVTGTYPTMTATLTGYAYETIRGKGIIAGKTKGPDVITMEPATLGKLALGRK